MKILKGDCLSIICKHLYPRDILNLLDALNCKEKILSFNMKESYLIACRNQIDNWFRDFFGESYENFKKGMILSKAMISGSFVLQNILNENWNDSDIDIFLREKEDLSQNPAYKYLCILLYSLQRKYSKGPHVRDNRLQRLESYSHVMNEIHRILEYKVKTQKFQCIHLNLENDSGVLDYINRFDFNFCKSIFYYDEKGAHLSIPFFEDVFFKRTKISSINYEKFSPSRWDKYAERGFSFL